MPEQWETAVDRAVRGLLDAVPEMTDRAHSTTRSLLTAAMETDEQGSKASIVDLPRTATAADKPGGRPPGRWLAAAAVVAAIATAAIVIPLLPGSASAAEVLNTAADRIRTSDEPLRSGQFRYIAVHDWVNSRIAGDPPLRWQEETLRETWVPADEKDIWMMRASMPGNRKWLQGNEQAAKEAGHDLNAQVRPPRVIKSACGNFLTGFGDADGGALPSRCSPEGSSWFQPSDQWMAQLPRDPARLLARLKADANGERDVDLVQTASDALSSGLLPADLRSALYRALARIDSLEVTEHDVNADGREGIALGVRSGEDRIDIIIDPETGQYIGRRGAMAGPNSGLEPGTVIDYSGVETAVVDTMGERPSR